MFDLIEPVLQRQGRPPRPASRAPQSPLVGWREAAGRVLTGCLAPGPDRGRALLRREARRGGLP